MLMDTGSSFSWLQCQPCAIRCYTQADPLFDPTRSTTYKFLSCPSSECSSVEAATLNAPFCDLLSGGCVYTATYGDASFSRGYLSEDLLTLTPSQILPHFVFGCGQNNVGLFGRSSGIIGLARHKLSMIAQLSTKYGYAFSYCLPRAGSPSGGGGFLSIGKILASSYKFTPMITDSQDPSLYFLRLTDISVAGTPIKVDAAEYKVRTIIDSGTVITRLPTSVYDALRQAFVKIMSTKYVQAPAYSILDTCFRGSLQSMKVVPQIRMVFQESAELNLGAANVLVEADSGVMCLAFAGNNEISIIGNHQQQTFGVAYDVASLRIGFAPNTCR
ncbi:Asp domain-containing protein [Cephalotus follicularis]|uniref:Asp domain-containing protein n=1 Tax=Cephalotus follicularis TaxID=3775 RepID=A0A1Q3BQW0_CEPFO|nr:Asp domain-containing protein [Cephalotus follicularis]